MKRTLFVISGIILIGVMVCIALIFFANGGTSGKDGRLRAIGEFGNLKIGDKYFYKAGGDVGNAYEKIPPSRFYIYVLRNDYNYNDICTYESCGIIGGTVSLLRGWLMGYKLSPYEEEFGLELNDAGEFPTGESSLIVVADGDSKIRGIHPNAKMDNLINILKLYPDLVDFDLLRGMTEFGPLEVGADFPAHLIQEFDDHIFAGEPQKKFTVYYIWNKPRGPGCNYFECGYHLDLIYSYGGDYLDICPDRDDVLLELGISPSQVSRGEATLMVITDSKNKITGIHPNVLLRDVAGILLQYALVR